MKKLLCLVLVLAMMATLAVSFGEEEKTYDLQGMTVKVRLWDFPNPYSEDTDKVNIDKYLPIFEAAKAKYNCDFAFYSPLSSTTSSPLSGCSPSRPAAPPGTSPTTSPECGSSRWLRTTVW